jgi:hypothetical protein
MEVAEKACRDLAYIGEYLVAAVAIVHFTIC